MAMPQREETIEEIKRLDALLEYAVMHGDDAEASRQYHRAQNERRIHFHFGKTGQTCFPKMKGTER